MHIRAAVERSTPSSPSLATPPATPPASPPERAVEPHPRARPSTTDDITSGEPERTLTPMERHRLVTLVVAVLLLVVIGLVVGKLAGELTARALHAVLSHVSSTS
jgi:hypothetical protein